MKKYWDCGYKHSKNYLSKLWDIGLGLTPYKKEDRYKEYIDLYEELLQK